MRVILSGELQARQPVHWLAEVAAVLARESPFSAETDIALLQALELPIDDSPHTLTRACRLAIELRQHLFDTLYHAVALENDNTTLITADDRYLAASAARGQITHLRNWIPAGRETD